MLSGFLAGILPLAVYFGSPFRSGYDFTGESTAFSISCFTQHLPSLLWMLNTSPFGLPVIFPAAILGLLVWIALTFAASTRAARFTKPAVLLLLWIVPSLLLHGAYYWSSPHPTIYSRLFLNIFPAVCIAAVGTAEAVTSGNRALRGITYSVLLGASLWTTLAAEEKLLESSTLSWVSEEASTTARESLPPGSILIADEMSAFHAAFATDFEIVTPLMFDEHLVAERVRLAKGPPPHELDSLRSERYLSRVAGRSQAELDALLRELILDRIRRGQRVGLLATDLYRSEGGANAGARWARRLAPSLCIQQLSPSQKTWTLYEVVEAQ